MASFNFQNLKEFTIKPQLFEQSTAPFWDDEHISKGMLDAHLNPNIEAASRKPDFILKSIDWILDISKIEKGHKILDLGCGPGLYTQEFSKLGCKVTGVDFSKRSVGYAKDQALKLGLDAEYIYKNYLDIDYENEFDVVTLIYCDFGVLSFEQTDILLSKIYKALKPNGKFIFDVFTPHQYDGIKEETKSWEYNENGGFWSGKAHLCLNSHYIYDKADIHLEQIIVCCEERMEVYRIWDHIYNPETIRGLLKKYFQKPIYIFSDVKGTAYNEDSKTMGIVAEK